MRWRGNKQFHNAPMKSPIPAPDLSYLAGCALVVVLAGLLLSLG